MSTPAENLRGALLMTLCMGAFATNDALMRAIAGELPVSQVVFIRGAVSTGLLAVMLIVTRGRLRFPGGRARRFIALRSVAEAGTSVSVVVALYHLPLSLFTAIAQVAPLAVALAGAVFLKEPVGWRRLLAIAVGFAGVMVIIRPGTDGFSVWSLMALLAVAFLTLRDLASRKIDFAVPPAVPAFVGATTITVLAFLWGLGIDWQPVPGPILGVLVVAGVLLVAAYLLAIAAMRVGEIGFVAPFRYMALVWALFIGLTFLGERLDGPTVIGCTLVVGSGGYSLWRELRRRRRASHAMTR